MTEQDLKLPARSWSEIMKINWEPIGVALKKGAKATAIAATLPLSILTGCTPYNPPNKDVSDKWQTGFYKDENGLLLHRGKTLQIHDPAVVGGYNGPGKKVLVTSPYYYPDRDSAAVQLYLDDFYPHTNPDGSVMDSVNSIIYTVPVEDALKAAGDIDKKGKQSKESTILKVHKDLRIRKQGGIINYTNLFK